jgi:hypothetical protein
VRTSRCRYDKGPAETLPLAAAAALREPEMPPSRPSRDPRRRNGTRRNGSRRNGIRRGAVLRPTGAPQGEDLQHLLKMIASSTDARRELVEDIRRQIEAGTYVTDEKLNVAIYRLLKDILN